MPKTWDELIAAMDEDTKQLIQSHEDSQIGKALSTFQKNHPTGDEQLKSIAERIKRIEAAKGNIEKQFELKATALQLCYENNIPFKMVESDLPHLLDEDSIKKKIIGLKEFVGDKEKNKINELLSNGFKPNSASDHSHYKLDLSKLEPEAMAELELSGTLDKILKSH